MPEYTCTIRNRESITILHGDSYVVAIAIAACLDRNSERIDFAIRKEAKDKGYSLKNPIPLQFVSAGTGLLNASPLSSGRQYSMRKGFTFLFHDHGTPVVLTIKPGDILRVFRR